MHLICFLVCLGPGRREKTFQLLVSLLRWFAHESGPMGLVFDNCHDLDASSLSVLQKMVSLCMFVCFCVRVCGCVVESAHERVPYSF